MLASELRLCPRRIYLTRAFISRWKDGLPVIAPARIGDSRASAIADNTLSSAAGCVWNRLPPEGRAPDTDGYDISEVRGDLRFSRPFIPILSPFSCFLFPVVATLAHRSPYLSHRSFGSAVVFLFYFFFSSSSSSRPRVSLVRFISPPRRHPNGVQLDSSQRFKKREKEEEMKKRSFSFSVSRRIVLLFAFGLRAFFERANEQDSRNAFSKLKTGLSASANSTAQLNHMSDEFKFQDKYAFLKI